MAIVAALPREVEGLVRGTRPDAGLRARGIYLYQLPRAVVVCAGMGSERATQAVSLLLRRGDISLLVSAGLAGACNPALAAGAVVEAATVVDASTGARFGEGGPTLVTTHTIAGVEEKRRLYEAYGAAAVDMEAATVARLAQANGLPFRAIKAISDAHDFELASLARFTSAHGHFRTRAFALHTALRPISWRRTIQLGGASQRALRALTIRLQAMLDEKEPA